MKFEIVCSKRNIGPATIGILYEILAALDRALGSVYRTGILSVWDALHVPDS